MDFSNFLNILVIRRTSWTENEALLKTLKIDNRTIPGLLIIENLNDRIFYRLYNKNLNITGKDTRETFGSLINEYIKTAPYINHQLLTTTKILEIVTTVKNEQSNNFISKISMQDLETCLHLMLRNEIPQSGVMKGEELYALRRWIRTLAIVSYKLKILIILIYEIIKKKENLFKFNYFFHYDKKFIRNFPIMFFLYLNKLHLKNIQCLK